MHKVFLKKHLGLFSHRILLTLQKYSFLSNVLMLSYYLHSNSVVNAFSCQLNNKCRCCCCKLPRTYFFSFLLHIFPSELLSLHRHAIPTTTKTNRFALFLAIGITDSLHGNKRCSLSPYNTLYLFV